MVRFRGCSTVRFSCKVGGTKKWCFCHKNSDREIIGLRGCFSKKEVAGCRKISFTRDFVAFSNKIYKNGFLPVLLPGNIFRKVSLMILAPAPFFYSSKHLISVRYLRRHLNVVLMLYGP